MRTDFERAYVTAHDSVAVLTLNHPEHVNAISAPMIDGLMRAIDHVELFRFRALIITGEGRGFCSGADLAEGLAEDTPDAASHIAARLDRGYHPLLRRLCDLPIPIVSAVNGAAVGIGVSIALMGDIIVAARSAFFQQSFVRIGLVPDGGSTWILPRLIGLARARELSMLGDKLMAEQALAWGLINRVYDDENLPSETLALARRLAEGPSLALASMRRLYWQSPQNTYEQQLALERGCQVRAAETGDFIEGISAFLQKRPPLFRGQ